MNKKKPVRTRICISIEPTMLAQIVAVQRTKSQFNFSETVRMMIAYYLQENL